MPYLWNEVAAELDGEEEEQEGDAAAGCGMWGK